MPTRRWWCIAPERGEAGAAGLPPLSYVRCSASGTPLAARWRTPRGAGRGPCAHKHTQARVSRESALTGISWWAASCETASRSYSCAPTGPRSPACAASKCQARLQQRARWAMASMKVAMRARAKHARGTHTSRSARVSHPRPRHITAVSAAAPVRSTGPGLRRVPA